MARFRGTVEGDSPEVSRLGAVIMETTCRGWDQGVTVTAIRDRQNDDRDSLSIVIDGGSNHTEKPWLLATITDEGIIIYRREGGVVAIMPTPVKEAEDD